MFAGIKETYLVARQRFKEVFSRLFKRNFLLECELEVDGNDGTPFKILV